jgi:lysophospholipase L1-like esterase
MPTPTPGVATHDVAVVVFYDENGNGSIDGNERVRLPDVQVEASGRTARTEPTSGRAILSVPDGAAMITIRADSLPRYFVPPAPVSVVVPPPAGSEVRLGVTLDIGGNRPNRYMAFGDSITVGDGSSDGSGYRGRLQSALQSTLGDGNVVNEGIEGTRSNSGALRLPGVVAIRRPAYTLILYGTNDWNECRGGVPCYTIDSLRSMILTVKGASSLPVLATIIPANPNFPRLVPPERNVWVHAIDELVRGLGREQDVPVADLEAQFLKQPVLTALFADHVHPNDMGYELIEEEFLRAITAPRSGASSSLSFFGRP